MSHYIERWECGHVASQCRCPGPKEERTRPGKCSTCAAQVSAMPERVLAYVSVFGTYSQIKDEYHDVECILVPESRLREAEAELEALRIAHSDVTSVCDDNAALRADLAALVPLARLGLAVLDGGRDLHKAVLASTAHDAAMALVFVDYPVVDGEQIVRFSLDQPTTTQARAILARETNDG